MTKYEIELINVTKKQFIYYKELIKNKDIHGNFDKNKINMFCDKAIKEELTVDKISRWLGFIQGVLFMNNLIDLDEERNRTRPLFQKIYKKYGINQETISI